MVNPIDNDSESVSPDHSNPDVFKAEIDYESEDKRFLDDLKYVIENDREILDRLADS